MTYAIVGGILLLASAVATVWTLRADRNREGFARDNHRIMLAFAAVNLLAAAVIFSSALSGA